MSSNNNTNSKHKNIVVRDKASQIALLRTAAVLGITINATIIYVLNDVKSENCACTSDWRFTFCYYYSILLIAMNTIILILGDKQRLDKFMPFINLMNLLNVAFLVSYLHKLASSACNCEYTTIQKMVRYGYTVLAFFYAVIFVYTIFFMLAIKTQK